MNMKMLLMASFAGMALLGGCNCEAAGIGASMRPAAQGIPAMLTPARRIGRGIGGVVRRPAPVVGKIARAAGKL